jgi:hypothetical protein
VGDKAVKEMAGVPAKVTPVVPLRFDPVMIIVFPPDTGPDAGVRAVMVGVREAA